MSKSKIYCNGKYLGEANIRVTPDPFRSDPIIVMFDSDNWRLYATEMFKGDPDNLIGVIQDNVFTFMKLENLSIYDYEFIVLNSTHEGFEVNSETEYKIQEP